MELPCRVGTTVEERAFPQVLKVSLRLETPLAKAGLSDSLNDTVDYAAVIENIKKVGSSQSFVLVERIAEIIAETVLKNPLIHGVEVKVGKKVFSGIENVGANIYREKSN